jgi:hypothetical protein
MSSAPPPNHIITNLDPPCASGVTLSQHRKLVVGTFTHPRESGSRIQTDRPSTAGSVLDLFQAKPSLYKLSFWRDDAVYEDP